MISQMEECHPNSDKGKSAQATPRQQRSTERLPAEVPSKSVCAWKMTFARSHLEFGEIEFNLTQHFCSQFFSTANTLARHPGFVQWKCQPIQSNEAKLSDREAAKRERMTGVPNVNG